ncbi:MAG TPA: L,D-transpeptidase [Aminivibrio sp.]|uniref:L,D-transpeptidase n=1 Tax=Aminivibrio sp. TaxID=1872489 RepID=UPI002B830912|nr:L,D-transpeptidase [Aminivibrio sp.]HPF84719.1 L,D-transpeptidase [Aminivibrio sp.]HPK06770.1 L,D-transpeptidase [Aminivibrio sp.]
MLYGKRRFPLWAKVAGLVLVVVVGFLTGYAGYTLYRDLTAPPPEMPAEPRPAELPAPPQQLPEHSITPAPLPAPQQPVPPSVPGKIKGDQVWLHVVKGDYRMYLYRGKNVERIYKVAVGANGGQKQRVGDSRTPTGTFSVQQIQKASSWTYDFGDGNGPTRGAYGPWFIRLKTPGWSGIGIHGTHDPGSIGTMITQGCVRMRNHELEELKKMVFVGMKVVISE